VLALFTDEQNMLKEMAASLAQTYGLVNPVDLESYDWEPAWRGLAQGGLLGLRVGTESGSPSASGVEVMIVADALASTLVPVPYLGSAVMATELVRVGGSPREWSEGLEEGRTRYTVMLTSDLGALAHVDQLQDAVAFDAGGASHALCLGGTEEAPQLVRLEIDSLERVDAADLTRVYGSISTTGSPESTPLDRPAHDRWLALGLVGVTADMVGAMRGALGRVVEYTKGRIQFGVPIGSFQAVQHLCAEAYVSTEASRTTNNYAAWAVDELEPHEALLAARTAKAYASWVGRGVCESVMQVYGGIGQTWETIAHFYLRRVLMGRALLGDTDAQLLRIADARLTAA
jgi:alkylation response protein AidB-like acyl-CoA dehydrogenase